MSDVMTNKEVCEEFKLAGRTLSYLIAAKEIPFSRITKRNIRFSRKRLEQWFKEREGVEYHRPTTKAG